MTGAGFMADGAHDVRACPAVVEGVAHRFAIEGHARVLGGELGIPGTRRARGVPDRRPGTPSSVTHSSPPTSPRTTASRQSSRAPRGHCACISSWKRPLSSGRTRRTWRSFSTHIPPIAPHYRCPSTPSRRGSSTPGARGLYRSGTWPQGGFSLGRRLPPAGLRPLGGRP